MLAYRFTGLDTWILTISTCSTRALFYSPEIAWIPKYLVSWPGTRKLGQLAQRRGSPPGTPHDLSLHGPLKLPWFHDFRAHEVPCGRHWLAIYQTFSLFLSARLYFLISFIVRWLCDWVLANRTRVEMIGLWKVGEKSWSLGISHKPSSLPPYAAR